MENYQNSRNEDITTNFLPLTYEEIVKIMQRKWGVTYDCQILVKGKLLYLQIMWGHIEQQSFPLSEGDFRLRLNKTVDIINLVNGQNEVREWLFNLNARPRLGRALTLKLSKNVLSEEFIL